MASEQPGMVMEATLPPRRQAKPKKPRRRQAKKIAEHVTSCGSAVSAATHKKPFLAAESSMIQAKPADVKSSPLRSLYSEFVFVDVGPERKRFGVHKGLISKYSAFFQATFDGQFAEAFKGTVELLEETPSIFDVVHTWLYSLEITQIVNEKDVPCTAAQHLALCIFDDKYDMPLLFNDTIDLIITYYEDKSQPLERKHVPYIYDNTVQDSPLRKLIVAMFHCGTQVLIDSLEKKREFYTECPEFMFDLTMDLLCSKVEGKDGLWKAPCYKDRCQYHRHGYSDDECV